jgi:transposase
MPGTKYDPRLKVKAVRLFHDHVAECPSQWAAMKAMSTRLRMTAETLREWVRQSEVDGRALYPRVRAAL